jgi:CHAT domain-containing protein
VCAELRGNSADATKHFEEARPFQADHPRCPPVTRAITLWRLAALADKAGRKDEAKKLITEVFDVADRARLNTFGEAAQRAQFFAQFAPAFDLLAAWYTRDGDGEGLFRVAVRSRSRTLLDQMLAAGVDPRDRLTGADRNTLVEREAAARRAVSRLRSQALLIPADGGTDPAAKKLLAELEAAQKEFTDAWREIANADPLTRVLTDPAFAESALAQVRKEAHKSGGVLLAYMIGRDESFAVLSTDPSTPPQVFRLTVPKSVAESIGEQPPGDAVARAGFRGVVIKPTGKQPDRPAAGPAELVPLTDAVAKRLVNQYLQQIADPTFNPTRGINLVSRTPNTSKPSAPEVLGDAILPPALREKLRASSAKRVVVIPDGALHKLPFECLLLSAGTTPKYAIDELPPVCYAPSIAALAVVLNRPRVLDGEASLLTVGDPAYPEATSGSASPLPRLPFTAVESKRIRQFFPTERVTALEGERATEANVVAALPGKRFVHLAAHGFADETPGNEFASIALTPPRGKAEPNNDGFLALHEIAQLKLTGCELTVLSACVTNVGPQRPMEAGVTLAGAFLGAGSRGVMASCWSVDDRATAELMDAFFGAIRPANGKGASYPEALKAARLAVRGKAGWEAPFYWAPFVYLGPPD